METFNHCVFLTDTIGLHRVENPSHSDTAVTLHLYSPPFSECQSFDERTGNAHKVQVTFWSQYGKRTPCVSIDLTRVLLLNSHETNNVIKTLPKFLILIKYCYYFNVELTLKQGLVVNYTLIELYG